MESKKEISNKVNSLIEKNNDAYKGFKDAADHAEDMPLRDFLRDESLQRKEFATELAAVLKNYNPGYDANTDGSVAGTMHRTWLNLKAALSGDGDESILEECVRGDKASVEEYSDFLKNNASVAVGIGNAVKEQLRHIVATLDRVQRLEDLH